ncbi:substrate-binding periplasmic protein [Candidatus Terasakiella magnetica]|nr:transporter substrate-binding domain-containing protein [Candidatus Terasakiella magnetica]
MGAEILKEAYGRLGHTIMVKQRPGSRAIKESNSGLNDGVVMRLEKVMIKNENLLKVDVPLWKFQVAVFSPSPVLSVKNWDDINKKRAATYLGYKYIESKLVGKKHDLVPSFEIGMRMLSKKRFDYLIYGKLDGLEAASKVKPRNIYCTSPIEEYDEFHMVHKSHAALVPKLNEVLRKMEKSKEIEKIQMRVLEEHIGEYSKLCD